GASVSDVFDITINNVNDAPTVDQGIADTSTAEDATFNLAIPADAFADLDGDALTYTATQADGSPLPSWLSFDGTAFSGTPTNDEVGAINLAVTASDGQASVTETFALTVTNTNDAPIVSLALADQSASENQTISFSIPAGSFSDVDAGDTLSVSATQADGSALPSWLTFDAATQSFSGTPGSSDLGTISIAVTATDTAGASVSDVFDITINNVNDAPTVDQGIADTSTAEDATFNLAIPADAFADLDGDALTYTATQADGSPLPSWLSFNGTAFSGTPTNDEVGAINLAVTASDGQASVTETFALTVTNTNDAPIVSLALADQSTSENQAISFSIPAGSFSDVDAGDTLSVTATQADGSALPSWLTFDAATQSFSGTPSSADLGTLSIEVIATDTAGASISDVFVITIESNAEPERIEKIGTNSSEFIIGGDAHESIAGRGGNDYLFGLAGDDLLMGEAGHDTLNGGNGNDILIGGAGSDRYYAYAGTGFDVIDNQSDTHQSDIDSLMIDASFSIYDIWFTQTGQDLDIHLLGGSDVVRVQQWFSGSEYELDTLRLGGSDIDAAGIQQLVNAMASYGAPEDGQMILAQEDRDRVNADIAASWQ
ncbi:MAG: putative Ig domain-containing protein, partial [Oleiphilaceae bacterium]|nr:putative Ig domain-containing protein [Oleiphilaceae bacterium]